MLKWGMLTFTTLYTRLLLTRSVCKELLYNSIPHPWELAFLFIYLLIIRMSLLASLRCKAYDIKCVHFMAFILTSSFRTDLSMIICDYVHYYFSNSTDTSFKLYFSMLHDGCFLILEDFYQNDGQFYDTVDVEPTAGVRWVFNEQYKNISFCRFVIDI